MSEDLHQQRMAMIYRRGQQAIAIRAMEQERHSREKESGALEQSAERERRQQQAFAIRVMEEERQRRQVEWGALEQNELQVLYMHTYAVYARYYTLHATHRTHCVALHTAALI
jgi:DNA-binding SARP family transcriptional activator